MQSFAIEKPSDATKSSTSFKFSNYTQEPYTLFILFSASLSYISIGYHLSIFNSISVFLWQAVQWEYDYSSFQNMNDAILAFGTAITVLLLCLNKIKFKHYKILLIFSDLFMILGTLLSFSVLAPESEFIFIGRFMCAESIGINIACIPSFLREVQFKVSQSSFKPETRKFFMEIFFALGVFLGLTPTQLIPSLDSFQEYIPGFTGEQSDYNRPDIAVCLIISVIPILASIVRIGLLTFLGDVKVPTYAPAFTDEGLCEIEENENNGGALYMLKFKEVGSLVKLFQYPFRRRLELCYLLYFLQVALGYGLFLVNPMKIALYLETVQDDELANDVQFVSLEYGAVYLVASIASSLLLSMYRIPRKTVMYIGVSLGIIVSFLLMFSMILLDFTYVRTLLLIYWASVCIGLGPIMEVYAEEMLPAKGLQLIQVAKWVLIGLLGLIFRSVLDITFYFIVLYMFYFVVSVLAVFIVHELVIETAGLSQTELNEMFAVRETEDLPEDKRDFVLGNSTEKEFEVNTKLEFMDSTEDFVLEQKYNDYGIDEIE